MSQEEQDAHLKNLLYEKHKASQKLGAITSKCRMISNWLPNLLNQFSHPHVSDLELSSAKTNFNTLTEKVGETNIIELLREAIAAAEEIENLRKDINATNGVIDD